MIGFGWRRDVLKKRKPNAPSNKVLGAHLDVSGVHTAAASATAEPDAETADALLSRLRACKARGTCSNSEAAEIVGQGNWMAATLHGRSGAAALQPFVQRQREDVDVWTNAMSGSLELLAFFLSPVMRDSLRLTVEMDPAPILCLLLYSDASFRWIKP